MYLSALFVTISVAVFFGAAFAYMSTSNKPVDTLNAGVNNIAISEVKISADKLNNHNYDNIINKDGSVQNLNPGDVVPLKYNITNNGDVAVQGNSYVYLIFDNNKTVVSQTDTDLKAKYYGDQSNLIDSVSLWRNNTELTYTEGEFKQGNETYYARRYEISPSAFMLNGKSEDIGSPQKIDIDFDVKFDSHANSNTMNQGFRFKTFTNTIQYKNTSEEDLNKLMSEEKSFFVVTGGEKNV